MILLGRTFRNKAGESLLVTHIHADPGPESMVEIANRDRQTRFFWTMSEFEWAIAHRLLAVEASR